MLLHLPSAVLIYRYLRSNGMLSRRSATLEAIKACGGTPIADSGERVSPLKLNGSHHYVARY